MSDTDEIKSRIDLVELVKEYVQLVDVGNNHRGLCPFHAEKTPSFYVSADKGIYKCFGCGEGGDHFSFLEKIEGMDFIDALQMLAKRAGIELKERRPEEKKEELDLQKIYRVSALYYAKSLEIAKTAEKARAYLRARGVSPQSIVGFQLGYAPESWDALSIFLLKKGFPEKLIRESGLVVERKGARGGYYDRFRDRVMFPIRSLQGEVIAFTSRTLKDDPEEAKYINSPQTPLYEKSRVLYALEKARQPIREQGFAVLVEGQMDVISSHQAGVENAVAPSGTAFTKEQAIRVAKYTTEIAFAFDADDAGKNALWKGARLAMEIGLTPSAIRLPDDADPDELIRRDPEAWKKAIADRTPALAYFLEVMTEKYDMSNVEQKKEIAAKLLPFVALLRDPLERDHYVELIANRLGSSKEVMQEALMRVTHADTSPISSLDDAGGAAMKEDIEELVLMSMLRYPELIPKMRGLADAQSFARGEYGRLYNAVVLFYTTMQSLKKDELVHQLEDEDTKLATVLKELLLHEEAMGVALVPDGAAVRDVVQRFLLRHYKRQIIELREALVAAEEHGKIEDVRRFDERLAVLSKKISSLRTLVL